MKKIRVMLVFGTRPEAIKMAPLALELKKRAAFDCLVCVTAQHREMLDSVLEIFSIKPDYDLDIMEDRQSLTTITSKTLLGMDDILKAARPDIVLVHGDTSTTFAGALSAFYQKIQVGHVEAGLRTFDKYSPYPEEMNRRLVSSIADLHFCPTSANEENLRREGVEGGLFVTGNTVIDALKHTAREGFEFKSPELRGIDFEKRRVILVTAHRRENYGEPMENIMRALLSVSRKFEDVEIVYPVHLSPAVRETAFSILGGAPRITLIDPVDVSELHNLILRCYMVMTDSGGLQEEAPALGKPVLVLRTETERPEAVGAGTVRMAGVRQEEIERLASMLLSSPDEYSKMAKAVNPYGDGEASSRIADAIEWHFGAREHMPGRFTGA